MYVNWICIWLLYHEINNNDFIYSNCDSACKTAEELGDVAESEADMFGPSMSNEPQDKPQEEQEIKVDVKAEEMVSKCVFYSGE